MKTTKWLTPWMFGVIVACSSDESGSGTGGTGNATGGGSGGTGGAASGGSAPGDAGSTGGASAGTGGASSGDAGGTGGGGGAGGASGGSTSGTGGGSQGPDGCPPSGPIANLKTDQDQRCADQGGTVLDLATFFAQFDGSYQVATANGGDCSSGALSWTGGTGYSLDIDAATQTITLASDGDDFSITLDESSCYSICTSSIARTIGNLFGPDFVDRGADLQPTAHLGISLADPLDQFSEFNVRATPEIGTPGISCNFRPQP